MKLPDKVRRAVVRQAANGQRIVKPSIVIIDDDSPPSLSGSRGRTIWRRWRPVAYERATWKVSVGAGWLHQNFAKQIVQSTLEL